MIHYEQFNGNIFVYKMDWSIYYHAAFPSLCQFKLAEFVLYYLLLMENTCMASLQVVTTDCTFSWWSLCTYYILFGNFYIF